MRDLAAVAERLRAAWSARRQFLELWAVEREVVSQVITPLLDRIADEAGVSTDAERNDHAADPTRRLDRGFSA